ncbi:MAG TPA: hypothetical protein VM364_20230, partial [Vicinamibacterales bacterium]|nr:hypothetical protein [Vicinamibacterales bacterium]
MTRHIVLTLAAGAVAASVTAHAQTAGAPVRHPDPGSHVLDVAVETRVTTHRPYSAEAVVETVQVLADGNRIQRSVITRVYRDGGGRTRRETIAGDVVTSISISDPVAHVSFTLDPLRKVAFRTGGRIVLPAG